MIKQLLIITLELIDMIIHNFSSRFIQTQTGRIESCNHKKPDATTEILTKVEIKFF